MLKRAGDEAVPTPAALSKLYTELAEPLSERFGLALGASEPWDERLWIKVKGGGMLFTEEELDAAAAAQRRLELMYSAHTWGLQLKERTAALAVVLDSSGGDGGGGETRDAQMDTLKRATKEAMAAVRLHRAIFAEGASKLILKQIDGARLPHALHADGDTLLAAIAALVSLALRTLRGLAARTAADAATAKGFARTLCQKAAADCQKGAEVLQPVLDAAKAYGVAIDADEAAGAARAVAELAPLTGGAGRRRRRGLDALKGDWWPFDVGGVREKSAGRGIHS